MKNYSPMMTKYLETKKMHKDELLFYRLGDFYEMFFDDAIVASRELELTLTSRSCGGGEKAPMCGVPHHAADTYIKRLMDKGFKVAICDQLSEPVKGELVDRDVTRIITAGTVVEDTILDSGANNYLLSVFCDDFGTMAAAWADISTGEIFYASIDSMIRLNELISRITPSEVICNELMLVKSVDLSTVKYGAVCPFTLFDESAFEHKNALERLKNHPFACEGKKLADKLVEETEKTDSLDFFGGAFAGGGKTDAKTAAKRASVSAFGGLLAYLARTQKKQLGHLKIYSESERLEMDFTARRTLELCDALSASSQRKKAGSLLWVLDKTKTAMGARTLKKWLENPLRDPKEINRRLDGVEELYFDAPIKLNEIEKNLGGIMDVERLCGRLSCTTMSPKDCLSLGNSLKYFPPLKKALGEYSSNILTGLNAALSCHNKISERILAAINPSPPATPSGGGLINKGYDKRLDEVVSMRDGAASVLSEIERREKEETGIKSLKIGYSRNFGYFIEVPKGSVNQVPYRYMRKQTLTGGERYITEQLQEIEAEILSAESTATSIETRLYGEILDLIRAEIDGIYSSAKAVSELDCLASLAKVARNNRYVRPVVKNPQTNQSAGIKIVEGRHPVVEKLLDADFVPNDTVLDDDKNKIMLITGPNMAGKSVYMRQVALITIMAQMGSFVPASSAEICVVDKIFTRVGASDDLISGRSTFMVEMAECKEILLSSTPNSLILLDEVGRGTSTYDGMSIAYAILKYIVTKIGAKTLFATHYHELTELEGIFPEVINYTAGVREYKGDIVFLHKILRGAAGKSYGVEVARLAGFPEEVIDDARQILKHLETQSLGVSVVGEKKAAVPQINEPSVIDPLVSKLQKIDTDLMSPMEALNFLISLKKEAKQRV